MANYYTHFSAMLDVGAANVGAALKLLGEIERKFEEEDENFCLSCEAQDGQLWIHDSDGGDIESALSFALACGEAFKLTGRWGFQYANTCDKPRLDGFGGGFAMVDFDNRSITIRDVSGLLTDALENKKDAPHQFIDKMAQFTTPEEDFEALKDADGVASNDGVTYDDVEEMVADMDDERLCGEYAAFMDMVREARKIRDGRDG